MKKTTMAKAAAVALCAVCAFSACACSSSDSSSTCNDMTTGERTQGSGAASFTEDTEGCSSAANLAVAYNEALNTLVGDGGTAGSLSDCFSAMGDMLPLTDMGSNVSDFGSAADKWEAAGCFIDNIMLPLDSATATAHVSTGRQVDDETMAAVQSAYEAAGGKATIEECQTLRLSCYYSYTKDYGEHVAGDTERVNSTIDNEYVCLIDGYWYLIPVDILTYM